MGASGTTRFRVIVLLLLALIFWQVYKLYPHPPAVKHDTEEMSEISRPEKVVDAVVYYEALCPDSRHFFIHHLQPTYAKLKIYMTISLIPYGKAKTIVKPSGVLEFECQHGEVECYANKIHACSIEAIPDTTEQIAFVNCMIRDNLDPQKALSRCGSSLSVDVVPISECAKGVHGSELLKKYGEATNIVKPTFIPTILLDGSKDNQAGILKNFILEVCKLFPDSNKPSGCG